MIEQCSRKRSTRALLRLAFVPLQRFDSIAKPRALRLAACPKVCDRVSMRQPALVLLAERPSPTLPSLPDSGFGASSGFLNLSTLSSWRCRSGLVSCRFRSWGSPSFRGFPSDVANDVSPCDETSPLGVVCPSWRLPRPGSAAATSAAMTGFGCLQGIERTRSPYHRGARFRCFTRPILSWTSWGRPCLGSQRASSIGRDNEVAAAPSAGDSRPPEHRRKPPAQRG